MKHLVISTVCLSLALGSGSVGAQTAMPESPPESLPPLSLPRHLPSDEPIISPLETPISTPTPILERLLPSSPAEKVELNYEFPKNTVEGQMSSVKLILNGVDRFPKDIFPIKGTVDFPDKPYNLNQSITRSYAFEIKEDGEVNVPLLFYTPGKKKIIIRTEVPHIPVRNVLNYIQPFKATTFPREVDTTGFSQDPKDWHVWVNLHVSYNKQNPQRQYYLISHKNQIVQKLLTSSGAASHGTPRGDFKLGVKMASPRSTKYDSIMPFWTTIKVPRHSFEYGNHGLVGESYLYRLGTPASHGCLRLSNKWIKQNNQWMNIGGAKWVYTHVPVNTPIHIFTKTASQPFVFENYKMWRVKKH